MKINCLLLCFLLLISCSKSTSEPKEVKEEPTSNDIFISGFKKEGYTVAQNGKILITPIIKCENEQTEEGLTFQWTIDKKVVSERRNLDIQIPPSISNGTKACRYRVHDKKYNKTFDQDFQITITNPFGYGFYFLSVEETGGSLLSHINVEKESETVFNTSVIGDFEIGNRANSLHTLPYYNESLQGVSYKLYITSSMGETPHIVTENGSLTPIEVINTEHNGVKFRPTHHFLGHHADDTSHFLFGDTYALHYNSQLTFQSYGSKNYQWEHLIAGNNDETIYAYNAITGRYHILGNERPIEGSLSLKEEKIIGAIVQNSYSGEGGGIVENVTILTSKQGQINQWNILNKHFKKTQSCPASGTATTALHVADEQWYISIGNEIFLYSGKSNTMSPFITLESSLGTIQQTAVSQKGNQLVVATYNAQTNSNLKGSIAIIDITTKKVTLYPNTIYNCVGIASCDSKSW